MSVFLRLKQAGLAAVPQGLARQAGVARLDSLRWMFLVYGALGLSVFWLYRRLPSGHADSELVPAIALGLSRAGVVRLAALFSIDAFAGGLVVNALLSLWLLQRFGLSLAQAGGFFFWAGVLSAASQLVAPRVAQGIGLLNTMVFSHLPANLRLVLAALAPRLPAALEWLLIRSVLSQRDEPTRTACVVAVVTPAERSAAASFTAVPQSLAAALSPTLSGALFALGRISVSLIGCGGSRLPMTSRCGAPCGCIASRDREPVLRRPAGAIPGDYLPTPGAAPLRNRRTHRARAPTLRWGQGSAPRRDTNARPSASPAAGRCIRLINRCNLDHCLVLTVKTGGIKSGRLLMATRPCRACCPEDVVVE